MFPQFSAWGDALIEWLGGRMNVQIYAKDDIKSQTEHLSDQNSAK